MTQKFPTTRRRMLASLGIGGALATIGAASVRAFPAHGGDAEAFDRLVRQSICTDAAATGHVFADVPAERMPEQRKLKLAWNATAVCVVGPLAGVNQGIYSKYNLDVELVNFGGSTDQLLEAIATGKADAGVGMALRWLKPLEQGFDVKITAGVHGGCMRLLAPENSKITDLRSLKGKTVAVADMTAPTKNLFNIQLNKIGIDGDTEVTWKQFPGELLRAAVEKGEADALADSDPRTYLWLKDGKFAEIASNLDGDYHDRSCCILGLRGSMVRNDFAVARALTLATLEAQEYVVHNPEVAARNFLAYAPPGTPLEDLLAQVHYHTHANHPIGEALKRQLVAYAEELKAVNVFRPGTNPQKFAERIYADVTTGA